MDEFLYGMRDKLDELISALEAEEQEFAQEIEAVHPTHREGARNLVHYQSLRRHDVRELQADLTSIGATSLSTAEPAVKARLASARNVVSAYLQEELRYPGRAVLDAFSKADEILQHHADDLLGEEAEGLHSRIMVTLPTEAADDADLVLGFAQAGMDLARINCAHDDADAWHRMIDNVRKAEEQVGRRIRVAMDLAGPKLRTGAFIPGPNIARSRVTRTSVGEVITKATMWLVPSHLQDPPLPPPKTGRPTLTVGADSTWLAELNVGSEISLIDVRDAKRTFKVVEVAVIAGVRCVLAEGDQNAYISNSTLLEHDWNKTRVTGILPSEQKMLVQAGEEIILTTDQTPTDPQALTHVVGCSLPEAVRAIEVGHRVLFDDGTIEARAREVRENGEHTEVVLEVIRAMPGGTKLAAYKGINLPETTLPLPSLTPEDIEAFEFVARHGDIANVSFIRTPEDVEFVLATLDEIAEKIGDPEVKNLGIVLKIETIDAYEQLAEVLLAGMQHENLGIMIARGDLAVEFGFERLAEVPRLIANMAEAAHVPSVMATQVLEVLAKTGLPARAEITDAAYALRTESVMLNKGPHITDAIKILGSISRKLGSSQRKNRIQLRKIRSWN